MRPFRTFLSSAAFVLASAPVLADVTPADVWETLEGALKLSDASTVTIGTVTQTPSLVAVKNIAIVSKDATGTSPLEVRASIPSIQIKDRGDGTSEVIYADVMPISIAFEPGEVAHLEAQQTNVRYIVSGDPDRMNFAMSGDQITVRLKDIESASVDASISFSMAFDTLSGTSVIGGPANLYEDYDGRLNVGSMTVDFGIEDAATSENAVMSATSRDLVFAGNIALPNAAAFASGDPSALGPDSKIDMGYSLGPTEVTLDMTSPSDGSVRVDYTDTGSSLDFKLNDGAMDYGAGVNGVDLSFYAPMMLPFPVEATADELSSRIAMPILKNVEAQYGLQTTLSNVTVSDVIWNLFDPAQILPRDPATIDLKLSGLGKWYFNIMDPAETMQMEQAGAPGEISSVNIDTLAISAVGLDATGNGAFTLDWTDMETFPGSPRPQGNANLLAEGLNGLIDNLIAMGLLSPEDAMGGRMMIAMFSQPGTGPDSLTSSLEINEQGHVLVNGQRIR